MATVDYNSPLSSRDLQVGGVYDFTRSAFFPPKARATPKSPLSPQQERLIRKALADCPIDIFEKIGKKG